MGILSLITTMKFAYVRCSHLFFLALLEVTALVTERAAAEG